MPTLNEGSEASASGNWRCPRPCAAVVQSAISDLAEATHGSRFRTTDVRRSTVALERRGLVVIDARERTQAVRLAEEP